MLAERLLAPVVAAGVDTLLLGCTHYPFLARTIGDVMGRDVVLVSSADETAFEVRSILADTGHRPAHGGQGDAPVRLLGRRGMVPGAGRPPARAGARRRRGMGVVLMAGEIDRGLGLSVTVLGCCGSFPGAGGACSGYLVDDGTTRLWLDAGSGTLANLQRHCRSRTSTPSSSATSTPTTGRTSRGW